MGRFTLSLLALLTFTTITAEAKKFEGINLPDTLKCGSEDLPLQGQGIRTATIFGIRVYVIAYYAKEKVLKHQYADAKTPMCFDVTYLRDVDNEDVDKAWKFQFQDSSEHKYLKLDQDIAVLQEAFGEIKGDRNHRFYLLLDKTELFENGERKGIIEGADFQKSFLSMWFGKKPPTKDVQNGLLGME